MDVRILTYEDTVELLSPADCVKAIQAAFVEEGKGETANRPRSHTRVKLPRGSNEEWFSYELKTMEGIIKAKGYAALRIASMHFRHYFVKGMKRTLYLESVLNSKGEKRWLEIVMLFDINNGSLVAIMPGGYIQGMRVGSSTAVGNSYMARKNSKNFAIIGSGWQARSQLLAHNELFSIERVKVYSVTPAHRERFAKEMSKLLGYPVVAVSTPEEAIHGSDVILCATNAHDPKAKPLKAEWLEPGQHWSIIQREAGKDVFDRSDRVCVLSYVLPKNAEAPADNWGPYIGEEWPVDVKNFPTLADLVAGRAKGRANDKEITGFVTTQGMGIQFVAFASVVYERARERNVGRVENWDHLLQNVHP